MHNLWNFLNRFSHWFLFMVLFGGSLFLLYRFNAYQKSVVFTAASSISGKFLEGVSYVRSYIALEEKNRELARYNIVLQQRVERLRSKLRADVSDSLVKERYADFNIIPARVINATVGTRNNYLTINKGYADGIKPEMGVVCGTGIVGVVYQTSANYAIVMSLLNRKTAVSCRLRGTDYFGYLHWNGDHSLYAQLEDIPRHAKLKAGMPVETSGFSAVFPPGIFVGKVSHISDSEDGLSYMLEVNLGTDFAKLSDVYVIDCPARAEIDSLERTIVRE